MGKKLNATERALAELTAQKYHKYERMTEFHCSILRNSDPTALKEAQAAYAKRCTVKEGFVPPPAERDTYIAHAEKTTEMKCDSLLEFVALIVFSVDTHTNVLCFSHLTVASAGLFLMHLYSLKAVACGTHVYYEAVRQRIEMECVISESLSVIH